MTFFSHLRHFKKQFFVVNKIENLKNVSFSRSDILSWKL